MYLFSYHQYDITTIFVPCFEMLFQAEYAFDVFTVEKCPMSKDDWDIASARLKCNSSHGYHCVPNKQFTSLIEFCYPEGHRRAFEKGILILLS